MRTRFTILGCGSSNGVPRVGNVWGVCDPANPRNRRRRCALLVEQFGKQGRTTVLVDSPTDVREERLRDALRRRTFRREGGRHDSEAEVWPVTETKQLVGAAFELEAEEAAHSGAAREVGIRVGIRLVECRLLFGGGLAGLVADP